MTYDTGSTANLAESLRQMVAVLQHERQALAGLDLDIIMGCAVDKQALCGRIDAHFDPTAAYGMDEECRGLVDAARRLNEVNRQLRNLISANVAARLEALTGTATLYRAPGMAVQATSPAYAYTGHRA